MKQDSLAPRFPVKNHPSPTSPEQRASLIADPGFGRIFTDHMASIRYSDTEGWHDGKITPRTQLSLDPATAVLHYAQEIFEGMKAYRLSDGSMALFRPEANAKRFNESARRMAMAQLPEEMFIESIKALVRTDIDWFPTVEGGAIYIRPFMFASEVFLGVKPSSEYQYLVIASPVGGYFKSGAPAIKVWSSQHYTRAAPGGTGAAKCGGNYAASLIAQAEATKHGCDQVVFLDAVERRYVEELGGMNLFFLFEDGRIVTPPLGGTILPGITRDSIITLAKEAGLSVSEELYSIQQWEDDAKSGKLTETFACGTAAVVTPVGKVASQNGEFTIGAGGPGQVTEKLKNQLVAIQRGEAEDRHGWVRRID